MLNVLDLFSGIGGFSLGLERTGGFKTVAFCEIDPYCQAVLRKHWPDVPIFDDVRQLDATGIETVDVVCGGPPCQPFSSAARGRTKGTADDRFLWPEMLRLVEICRPTWVVFENVTHIDRVALERLATDLEALDYNVGAPLEIPACAVGHDHWRPRLWLLGHANGDGKPARTEHAETPVVPSYFGPRAGDIGATNGVSDRLDGRRRKALGNAIVPQIPEIIGRAILAAEDSQ